LKGLVVATTLTFAVAAAGNSKGGTAYLTLLNSGSNPL
jgi:hypothetical protein